MRTTDERAPAARCCEEMTRAALSRRTLLKGALAGAAAVPLVGLAGVEVAYAAPGDTTWNGDTLIVLSLRGGFDGLSAVVPIHDDLYPDYARLRPTIGVPQNRLIDLDGRFGLHPALQPLKTWYDQGCFGAVVATGLPAANRSHFDATDEIEHGTPGSLARDGWLNRWMARHHGALTPLSALQVGSNTMPMSLQGPEAALGLSTVDSFELDGADTRTDPQPWTLTPAKWTAALTALSSGASTPVKASTRATLGALADVATVAAAPTGAGYPGGSTSDALADVARLIRSGLGVKLVTLDVGDWDMHAGLGRSDRGWMYDNLSDLGQSLAAFAADLGPELLGRVTLVTISEFGRRVQENESGGLDHGWGNVMFVLGGHVASGVKGTWRGLTTATMADGDVFATTDYRAVLAEILAERCLASPEDVAAVFPTYRTGSSGYPGIFSG